VVVVVQKNDKSYRISPKHTTFMPELSAVVDIRDLCDPVIDTIRTNVRNERGTHKVADPYLQRIIDVDRRAEDANKRRAAIQK
jgi:hypothetical protein